MCRYMYMYHLTLGRYHFFLLSLSLLSLLVAAGELQSVLCAAFCSAEVTITGTLSGDLYKWSGHNLASVVKGAHTVSAEGNDCVQG